MELLTDGSKDAWAEEYGLDFPVMEDPNQEIVGGFVSGSFGIPMYVVLDRNLEMVAENIGHGQAFQTADELLETDIPDHSDEWPMPEDLDLSGVDVELEGDPSDTTDATVSGFTPTGTPFGGASCSAAADAGAGAGSLLLGLLGVVGIRRRR